MVFKCGSIEQIYLYKEIYASRKCLQNQIESLQQTLAVSDKTLSYYNDYRIRAHEAEDVVLLWNKVHGSERYRTNSIEYLPGDEEVSNLWRLIDTVLLMNKDYSPLGNEWYFRGMLGHIAFAAECISKDLITERLNSLAEKIKNNKEICGEELK